MAGAVTRVPAIEIENAVLTKLRMQTENLRTEDIVGGSKRDGMLLVAERTLENGLRVEAGIRTQRFDLRLVLG